MYTSKSQVYPFKYLPKPHSLMPLFVVLFFILANSSPMFWFYYFLVNSCTLREIGRDPCIFAWKKLHKTANFSHFVFLVFFIWINNMKHCHKCPQLQASKNWVILKTLVETTLRRRTRKLYGAIVMPHNSLQTCLKAGDSRILMGHITRGQC